MSHGGSESAEDSALRELVVETAIELGRRGLNRGSSGNVSARCGDRFLMTPSGVPFDQLTAELTVSVAADGSWEGALAPTSEWQLHLGIYSERPDVRAVVHTHSDFATVLACRREEIPAFHYMIAVAGGTSIRCAPYATFGTTSLADAAVEALAGRTACLLANHGMIAAAADLHAALRLAEEVEGLSREYCRVLQLGGPKLLTEGEMAEVLERFKTYGVSIPRG